MGGLLLLQLPKRNTADGFVALCYVTSHWHFLKPSGSSCEAESSMWQLLGGTPFTLPHKILADNPEASS